MGIVRSIDDHRGVAVRRYHHSESMTSIAAVVGRSRRWVYKRIAQATAGKAM